jgi:hypothetical protein
MTKRKKSLDAQQSFKMERRWNFLVKAYRVVGYADEELRDTILWADKIVQKYLSWEKEKDENV